MACAQTRTYIGIVFGRCRGLFYSRQLRLGGDGLLGDLVKQLREHLLWVVEFRLDFLEHGEVLDYLLRECVDGACKVCEGGQEAGRAVGSLGRLLHPAGGEPAGEGARIVVGRSDRGPPLSRRRSSACGRRHGGCEGAPWVAGRGKWPRTRSAQDAVCRKKLRGRNDVWAHLKR